VALQDGEIIMANIGSFTKTDTGYLGMLRTLTLTAKAAITPNARKTSEAAPDFRIVAKGAEIGAGWKQIAKGSGAEYLSIKLDDPTFAASIRANLVGNAEGGFDLLWSR